MIRNSLCKRLFWLFLLFVAPCAAGQNLLPPALVFKPSAVALDSRQIELRFAITKGYYLYRDKFRFAVEPATVRLGSPEWPPGQEKEDDNFGRVEVYYGEFKIRLPVERPDGGALPLVLTVSSQGCAEIGVCYPPQQQMLALELPALSGGASEAAGRPSGDESGRIARLFEEASLGLIVASFFGFGLLLSLTPCVLPMIPILSGIIVGAGRGGQNTSSKRGFVLSLAYVLGMASTYALAGVAAGYSGTLLSSELQNAWVLGGFALLFVALSLSMFGFYELQLPSFVQSRLSGEATRRQGGSLLGLAVMGMLSALIIGPCVAAPLAGALLYIGRTGDAWLGGLALFCLALGMGAPLLAVGASAGRLLPRSGPWMTTVNKIFGVILLATALWIVSPVVPVGLYMAAWAILLIVCAVKMRAIDPLPVQTGAWPRVWKGLGVVLLLAGAAMLAGALSGAPDPLRPLAVLQEGRLKAAAKPLPFERVRTVAELDARLKDPGQPVLLDFYADWCVTCKQMERSTFSAPAVHAELAGWRLLRVDVTANSADDKALLMRFKLPGPPGVFFFDSRGAEIQNARVVGYMDEKKFLGVLPGLH